MQTFSFDVSGMTCGDSTGSMRRALGKTDGIGHAATLGPAGRAQRARP